MEKILLIEWLLTYEKILQRRIDSGLIKPKTACDYRRMIWFCLNHWARVPLVDISVADITSAIMDKAEIAPFSARRLRINISDVFIEAQRAGCIPLGHNPALVCRKPITFVSTERLTLDEWLRIFRAAKYVAPDFFQVALLLALVTGQRPSDLCKMDRSDIKAGYLHIEQFKTGERIALPLSLGLHIIGTTLDEVLSICEASGPLLQSRGRRINTWTLSRWFRICREQAGVHASNGTPPTFREQRSLSERLYRAQGLDTQTLLGHKSRKMTDSYNDIRGKGYRVLII
ncbi:tyrosine-type recombinase/integrase [Enterobacter cloacae]|uniref:tyrosine-type recombinase/integrase n=1 Tax=Enterobacter cloacae TaxID=550 RepID=UPI0013EFB7E2|nr:tyrosine-type recombinase/integrase [Enterobacter cloacae]